LRKSRSNSGLTTPVRYANVAPYRALIVRENGWDEGILRSIIEHDEYLLRRIGDDINRPPFVVDVGGHIGSFVLAVKALYPGATVHTFEPLFEAFQLLRANTQELRGVHSWNIAVVQKGYATRPVVTAFGGERVFLSASFSGSDLPSVPLQDILGIQEARSIDLLKLDCEGTEGNILWHMPDDLLSKVVRLRMELHLPAALELSASFKELKARILDRFTDEYPDRIQLSEFKGESPLNTFFLKRR
jgi:FkbM family methyltransferase